MNEQVIVDFSRVDAALDLTHRGYEVAADRARVALEKERSEITTRMIKYGAAACALIIVSIGLAIWLARQRHVTHVQASAPAIQFPSTAMPISAATPNKIRTKITLFNSIAKDDLAFRNVHFYRLTAGHEYSTSNADHWEFAWCYADFRKDGLEYTVTLANRTAKELFPRSASQSELRELALSQTDVSFLANRCPWREQ